MKNVSKNLQLVVKSETGDNIHKFAVEYLGEERSDKLRAWIKGTQLPNLKELDKMVEKFRNVTGKELSLDWLVYNRGEMFTKYEQFIEENMIMKKELEAIKEEYAAFKKMALANFHSVDISNQFADRLEEFDKLSDTHKNFWTGLSFLRDLIDLSRIN